MIGRRGPVERPRRGGRGRAKNRLAAEAWTSAGMEAKAPARMTSGTVVLRPGAVRKRAGAERAKRKTQAGSGRHNSLPCIVSCHSDARCFHPDSNAAGRACQAEFEKKKTAYRNQVSCGVTVATDMEGRSSRTRLPAGPVGRIQPRQKQEGRNGRQPPLPCTRSSRRFVQVERPRTDHANWRDGGCNRRISPCRNCRNRTHPPVLLLCAVRRANSLRCSSSYLIRHPAMLI